jgi:hypothetical protein
MKIWLDSRIIKTIIPFIYPINISNIYIYMYIYKPYILQLMDPNQTRFLPTTTTAPFSEGSPPLLYRSECQDSGRGGDVLRFESG